MTKKVFSLSFLIFLAQLSLAQSAKSLWVDSVFNTLDANARIGQLFMVSVGEKVDAHTIHEIESRIKSHEIGGLIFRNVGPVRQVNLINQFQRMSDVPLLIAQESELSALLDSTIVFPPQIVLGAIQNDTLLYRLGQVMAGQLKLLGSNLVFNPAMRMGGTATGSLVDSFGETRQQVTQKSLALMRGLQDHGVISCARYFPLKPIPLVEVPDNIPQLKITTDSVQRLPYAALIANGLKNVTPESYTFASYRDQKQPKNSDYSAATLTTLYSGQWLRRKLDFHGLTFIDISKIESQGKEGDTEVFAFQTGNDVLMNPADLGAAIRKIKKLIKRDEEYERQLDNSVKKILEAKFEAGLWKREPLSTDNLISRLNNPETVVLNKKLYEAAVTVVKNINGVLPLQILENRSFAYINTAPDQSNLTFHQYLKKYVPLSPFLVDDHTKMGELQQSLTDFDVIIVGIYPGSPTDIIEKVHSLTTKLKKQPQVIFCDFGHSGFLAGAHRYGSVITGYVAVEESYKAVSQVMFGALRGTGRLPFSPSGALAAGDGVNTPDLGRLQYSIPEDARMSSRILMGIDSIAREAIRMGATPGCQVFVARKGKVIYEKSFGHLTYDKKLPVTTETIYDLASVTKVAATLQTAMFMHEKGIIDLNKKVSHYLPELRKTNKKDITFIDMLTHQSGLIPFLPMYPQTMKDTAYLPEYYSRVRNEKYPLQVSSNLYASAVLRDSVWSWVVKSKMGEKPARTPYSYKYSDFGFLIMQRVAEKMLNQPMDEFVSQNFYEPMGAYTLGFNPLTRFQKQEIAPTEDDKIYRRTFVSGTVHDERAAMMGGVAGHAGLFGNANDLGKLGQMLLQKGYYGGTRYFRSETVSLFTGRKYRTSRRGIGWDKPLQSDPNGPTSIHASPSTFGHTGFTGTCIWVDPEFDLVYVFLSNRVYPDRNSKLITANIRSRIQDVIYKSIFGYVDQDKPSYIANNFAINANTARPLK